MQSIYIIALVLKIIAVFIDVIKIRFGPENERLYWFALLIILLQFCH